MRKSSIIDFLLILLYKAALDLALMYLILPVYSYTVEYSEQISTGLADVVWGYVAVIFCVQIFHFIARDARITRFVLCVQLMLIVIPGTALFSAGYLEAWHLGLIILGFIAVVLSSKFIPAPRFHAPSAATRRLFAYFAAVVIAYVYLGLFVKGGLGRFNLNFADVYQNREMYADSLLPGFGYFVPWVAYVFNMTWLVIAMRRHKKIQIALILGLQVLLFAMTNFKAFFFVPFAVVGLIALGRRLDIPRATLIGLGSLAGLFGVLNATGIGMAGALFNRMFYTPAAQHRLYFDYFFYSPIFA